jgi:hypothetical protein
MLLERVTFVVVVRNQSEVQQRRKNPPVEDGARIKNDYKHHCNLHRIPGDLAEASEYFLHLHKAAQEEHKGADLNDHEDDT